jgi:iron complex outermembrane receptor protein
MKKSNRITLSARLLAFLLALGMVLVGGPAMGQDASDEEEFMLEDIVVTGSRIPRRDYESYSPIVTVNADTFEDRSNIGLESALNQMPQFTPAGTQALSSPAGTPFPASTAAPGAATVNLRGLGTNRNLVLVDGKRVQPINANLVVDLNTIPSAAVESVEVITGGAAAVYGADAISGVVNLILKKDFKGATFDAQYGITEEGDGEEFQFSGLLGADIFDDRGNVMMGFSYADRDTILGKDREFIRDGWLDPGTLSQGIQPLGSSNLVSYNPDDFYPPTGGWGAALYTIDQNSNVFDPADPFNTDHPYTGPIGYDSGFKISPIDGSLTYYNKDINYLQLPLTRYSIFGSGRFGLTDTIEFYMDLRYSETQTLAIGSQQQFFNIWGIQMPYNQQYDDPDSPDFGQAPAGVAQHPVPAGLADLLNSRVSIFGDPTFDPLTAPWNYEGAMHYLPPYQTLTTSNVFQVSGGLRGEFGSGFTEDWTWDVYYSHGKSTINAQQPEGFTHLQRSQQVFESDQYGMGFVNPYGIAVTGSCESGIPVFNEDGSFNDSSYVSQDCADYMTLRMNTITTLEQNVAEANMQGSIFELPAGKLQFAAGAAYREEEFHFEPDTGYNANQIFPNVVGNIALPVAVNGSTDVSELYAELLIPVVKDLPLVKSFTLEPGYRISDYSIAEGKVDTYKVMADWKVIDEVRFRGGVQRANRAPNVAELFTPAGASTMVVAPDTCGNWEQGPDWGNKPENPNRYNVQVLCQELMVRDGAPENFPLYVPGASADDWAYNVFGGAFYFPFSLGVMAGNPDLESETADTQTLGIVIDSPFSAPAVQNMRISIDYYKIEVEGAIGIPGHDTVYQQCLDAQYNPLIGSAPGTYTGEELAAGNPYCALINREYLDDGINVFGADRKYQAPYINQGALNSVGYDIQLDWNSDFSDIGLDSIPGRVGVNILVSILDEYSVAPFPGADLIDYTGTVTNSSFDYQALTTLTYSNRGFSGGLRWMHLPKLDPSPSSASDIQGVDSYDQFDLFARYLISDGIELRGGINNLFYAKPNPVGASSTDNNLGSAGPNEDIFGRRYYVAAKVWF